MLSFNYNRSAKVDTVISLKLPENFIAEKTDRPSVVKIPSMSDVNPADLSTLVVFEILFLPTQLTRSREYGVPVIHRASKD